MRFHTLFVNLLPLMALMLDSCGPGSSPLVGSLSQNANESPWFYFNNATRIGVEVFYEAGVEPYVGNTATPAHSMPYWQILEDNLKSLFYGRASQPTFVIPKDLAGMRQMSKKNQTDWTNEQIVALSEQLRVNHSNGDQAWFCVLFLNGYYNSNGATQSKVLGVSIGGTSVIAMFKPVIEASSPGLATSTDKYVEQSTLVHEMGHALGLVNNGLPFADHNHEDSSHTTHCSNPNCVMYWENSGVASLTTFLTRFQNGNTVMYGDECLKDARLYHL